MKKITLILMIASLLSCCKNTAEEFSEPGSDVISKLGSYDLKSVGYKFSITRQDSIIRAELLNDEKKLVSRYLDGGSLHTYFFVWDKDNQRLWYNNSDVGVAVWIIDDEKVELVSISKKNASAYVPMMPLNFFEALPNSLQNLWKNHKGTGNPLDQ